MSNINDINSNALVSYSNSNKSTSHSEPVVDFEGMPLGLLDHRKSYEFPNFWLNIAQAEPINPPSEITDTGTVLPYISGRHVSTDAAGISISFMTAITQVTFAATCTINGKPEDYQVICRTVDGGGAILTFSGDAHWHTLTAKDNRKITDFFLYHRPAEAMNFRFDNVSVKL